MQKKSINNISSVNTSFSFPAAYQKCETCCTLHNSLIVNKDNILLITGFIQIGERGKRKEERKKKKDTRQITWLVAREN